MDAPESQAPAPPPHDMQGAMALLVGLDPLVRRPPPLTPASWTALDGGAPIAAWAALALRDDATAQSWQELETRWAGTIAVPLARGAELATLETLVARGPNDLDPMAPTWLGPLSIDHQPAPTTIRSSFDWLAPGDPKAATQAALAIAERRVLLGWLDGPDIPIDAVAQAMRPGIHDRLSLSAAGALIQARAAQAQAPDRATQALSELSRVTTLALQEAAADRDAEQARWVEQRGALREELGEHSDPITVLLTRSREGLTANANDDASAGAALIAMTAERLHGSCPEGNCAGLDRVATLRRATVWSPDLAPLAASWETIALKHAIDHFEVTHDRPNFARGLGDLADAIIGSTGGALPIDLLRQSSASPTAFLILSRSAGGEQSTEYEGARLALLGLLRAACDHALDTALTDEQRAIIQRIRHRAQP